jgi:hypothetical protein
MGTGRFLPPLVLLVCAIECFAQTSTFSYQGRLTDAGLPASGSYEMQFKLFDAATPGNQTGPTLTFDGAGSNPAAVTVTNGVFAVQLDFGAGAFPGADRYLEIGFRRPGETSFTPLTPRQPIAATPYAVRSLSAATADIATDAKLLGAVAASQYVQTGDARLSDARRPTAGSSAYIQNTTTTQAATSFNISDNGTAGGTLSGNTVNATIQYNIGGVRVLRAPANNLFAGIGAGNSNTTGGENSFFGYDAGKSNTTGNANSFFGMSAGKNNAGGLHNSFFGANAGLTNTFGFGNSFFGTSAGASNTTGSDNSFFGTDAGLGNTLGHANSFVGMGAGQLNTTGSDNSFFGKWAGNSNTTGNSNSFVGKEAGFSNTSGSDNSFFGWYAGRSNINGSSNSFFGTNAGGNNTEGGANSFFGSNAGKTNTTGLRNSFFGWEAGLFNTTGHANSFVGARAG